MQTGIEQGDNYAAHIDRPRQKVEDELKERFDDCFDDKDEVIANDDNHDEFRDEDFA